MLSRTLNRSIARGLFMNNAVRPMTSLAIGHPHPHHLPHLHCVHFHPQRRRAFSQSLSGESKASNPSSTQNHRELTIDADDVKVLHDEGKLTSDGNSDDVTPTVIDGREISEESVEHFINSIGSSNPEDIEKFQQLAEKHLSHINFEAFDTSDFDPSKLGDIAELQQSVEEHVNRVRGDTVTEMVNELMELRNQHLEEFAQSNNPDFEEFPARDIISDVVEDAELVDDIIKAFEDKVTRGHSEGDDDGSERQDLHESVVDAVDAQVDGNNTSK